MHLGKDEARAEMQALLEGRNAPRVSSMCTLCLRCNNFCGKGLRPYELILDRVTRTRDRGGRWPALAPYMLNGMPGPNFFRDIYSAMSPEEREILERWSRPPEDCEEALFVGCTGRMFCRDIDASKVLGSLAKFGPVDVCCGELHYRGGFWDAYSRTVERALEALEPLPVKRLVSYCESCTAFLRNVLPHVYGRELPFEVVSVYEWLLERIESGELRAVRPMGRVAVHESCSCADLGPDFYDVMRKVLAAAGADVVDLEHRGPSGISCGAASVARRFKIRDVLREQRKKYCDVRLSGARDLTANCPGCYLTLSATNRLFRVRLHYTLEEVLKAFGDDITVPIAGRVNFVNKIIIKRLPGMLGRHLPRMPEAAGPSRREG